MLNRNPTRATVENLRKQYPNGTQVELISMDDQYSKLKPGDRGTVDFIDDTGTIFCVWDNGSTLGVVYGVDVVKLINEESSHE